MQKVSIKKNFILSTAYQLLLIVAPLVTAPYVARVLGPDRVGIYSATNSIQMYFSLFAALGTASYGAREISRARDDEAKRSKLFWEIELLTVATTLVILVIWGAWIAVAPEYKIYYLVLTLNLFNTMFDISWFFKGLEQFSYTVRQNTIFKLLGIVLLFILIKDENDLALYIALMCCTSLFGTLSMWIYLPRFLVKVDRRSLRIWPHLRETLVYFVPTIATSVYTYLDKTLIYAIARNPSENGYYEEATKIVNLVKSVTFTSLNAVLEVRASYLFLEKKYDEIKEKIRECMDYILFMGIGACLGLIGIAERFVPLFFGESFRPVTPILMLLSPVVVIIGISNCIGSLYYTPAGLRKKSAGFIVIGAVINFCMNLLLIPRLGGLGAVAGTLIAETVITVLYMAFCDRYLTVGLLVKLGWKKLAAGVIMAHVVWWIGTKITGGFLSVAVQVLIGGSVYLIVLFLLHDSFLFEVVGQKVLGGVLAKVKKKFSR